MFCVNSWPSTYFHSWPESLPLELDPVNHLTLDWISAEFDILPGFVCTISITVLSLSIQPSHTRLNSKWCPLREHWQKEVRSWNSSNLRTGTDVQVAHGRKASPVRACLLLVQLYKKWNLFLTPLYSLLIILSSSILIWACFSSPLNFLSLCYLSFQQGP